MGLGVAGLAVDLVVGSLAHRGRVQLLVALNAAEAVLVVRAEGGHHALSFKYLVGKKLLMLKFTIDTLLVKYPLPFRCILGMMTSPLVCPGWP